MKYLWMVAFILAGCTSRYDAQVAQAEATQAQAQAAMVQAEQQAQMFATLADAAKPTYWPIVALCILAVVAILLIVRWHMVTVAHVAAGQPMPADALRLLPTDDRFYGALRLAAKERGASIEVSGNNYYLVDGEQRTPVRQLMVRGER